MFSETLQKAAFMEETKKFPVHIEMKNGDGIQCPRFTVHGKIIQAKQDGILLLQLTQKQDS